MLDEDLSSSSLSMNIKPGRIMEATISFSQEISSMSAPIVIDPLDFARNAEVLHGKIPVSSFGRLRDYLTDDHGELQYSVTGGSRENAEPNLQIGIQGPISLKCQRCLGRIQLLLDLRTDLLLARNESELARFDADASVDCILATPELDITALVEDEIILSLPASPRHGENECTIDKRESGNTIEGKSPFSALAALKKLH
jgi:uncharacterized protein